VVSVIARAMLFRPKQSPRNRRLLRQKAARSDTCNYGCRNRRTGSEAIQEAAGEARHDVRVADSANKRSGAAGEGEVGVTE
jgi:hypothetical protein